MTAVRPMIAYKTHGQIARERGHHDEKCQGTMQIMHTDTYGASRMVEIHCDACNYEAAVPREQLER